MKWKGTGTFVEIPGTRMILSIMTKVENGMPVAITGLLARVDKDGEVYCERKGQRIWERDAA